MNWFHRQLQDDRQWTDPDVPILQERRQVTRPSSNAALS